MSANGDTLSAPTEVRPGFPSTPWAQRGNKRSPRADQPRTPETDPACPDTLPRPPPPDETSWCSLEGLHLCPRGRRSVHTARTPHTGSLAGVGGPSPSHSPSGESRGWRSLLLGRLLDALTRAVGTWAPARRKRGGNGEETRPLCQTALLRFPFLLSPVCKFFQEFVRFSKLSH